MKHERKKGFLSDIATLRQRARQHISDGAVTPSYSADRVTVLKLLNEALATEIVCTLRYRRHYFMAEGILAEGIKQEFLVHAQEEQGHADQIAERIVQLGGEPDFDPSGLAARSHAEYVAGGSLEEMLKEDLIAERIAIESYREMIGYMEQRDSTTRRMLEGILANEEKHAEELSSMMEDLRQVLGLSSQRERVSSPTVAQQSFTTDEAVKDPTARFDSPRDVLDDDTLSYDDKRRVLVSWVKDAELLSEAETENMGGGEKSQLQESKLALARLDQRSGHA